MSCVPHVMYGLVCVVNLAIALLRICMMKYEIRCCYPICDGCPSFSILNLRVCLNLLAGLDIAVKLTMDLLSNL